MQLFDLFVRSRPRCAPQPQRRTVRFSLEQLETRLAPSGIGDTSPTITDPTSTTPISTSTATAPTTTSSVITPLS